MYLLKRNNAKLIGDLKMKNDYQLAATITEKQVDNVLNSWDENSADMKSFKCLVRLGDGKQLAMASILNRKLRESATEEYERAYYS